MKKKIVAVTILLAVLFEMGVSPKAGTVVRSGNIEEQVSLDISGGKMHLNDAKKASEKVVAVSLGEEHSGAVMEDGTLYMWGSRERGQVGDGLVHFGGRDDGCPVKVMEDVQTVSLGDWHSGAVTKDGTLYMWGNNDDGQLGDGTNENRSKPVKVMENVQTISLGCGRSAAVTKDGSLYMWGGRRNRPEKVMEDVQSVSLSCHQTYDFAILTKNGTLYWPNFLDDLEKVMENVQTVSLGENHRGVVTKDGRLYMWLYSTHFGYHGELGDGSNDLNPKNTDEIKMAKVMENVQTVSLGEFHSGAVTKDGSLYMWGDNANGKLGDGTLEQRNSPVKVMENVQTVSLGENHSGAVTRDGSLYMWGDNISGQISGEGLFVYKPVKINFGDSISQVALKTSQKITCHSKSIKKGKVAYGTSFSLNAKSTGAGKLTYKSSDKKILSVNSKGKVTVKGYGPATIKIRASAGNGYKASVRNLSLSPCQGAGRSQKQSRKTALCVINGKRKKQRTATSMPQHTIRSFPARARKRRKKRAWY